jgi:hypothetical protein
MIPAPPGLKPLRGFSLVEVVLALGVTSISLLSLLALLPVGLSTSSAAIEQTAANGLLTAVLADLQAIPPTQPRGAMTQATQSRYGLVIPASEPITTSSTITTLYFSAGGQCSNYVQEDSSYRLTLTYLPCSTVNAPTQVKMLVSWPATMAIEHARSINSVTLYAALDRN